MSFLNPRLENVVAVGYEIVMKLGQNKKYKGWKWRLCARVESHQPSMAI